MSLRSVRAWSCQTLEIMLRPTEEVERGAGATGGAAGASRSASVRGAGAAGPVSDTATYQAEAGKSLQPC